MYWGDGTQYGDPNARWGNPSYVLEPGDPGYVVPAPAKQDSAKRKTKGHIMSSNITPTSRNVLLALAGRMHAGQVTYGATVGLHHHQAAAMDEIIKKIIGDPAAQAGSAANKGSQLLYRDCVDATGDAETAHRDLSDGPVKLWLDGYRKVMGGIHGAKADAGWVAAGFPPGHTNVPRNHDARLALLGSARAYLAAHSCYETSLPQASGPALAVTAAEALARHTAMQTAQTLINTRAAEQATCKAARDADVEALYAEVSATTTELGDLLEDNDPRWELFGLNIPANPNPPAGVDTLSVISAGPGRELVAWSYAPRAEYYRLYLKRVGVDDAPVNVADPRDLEHTVRDLTAGGTIEVQVVPMNSGGAGAASPLVTKVVGA